MTGQQNSDSLIKRLYTHLETRRDKILSGQINCIPLPFYRFRSEIPGITQGTYYLVSGATKSGKSQITNYLFVYNSILYSYNHPEQVIPKIFYYNIEETAESITLRFVSYLLYTLDNIRISPIDLESTNSNNPLSKDILDLLNTDKYLNILKFYEEHVSYMGSKNPTGIWKDIKAYADNNGKAIYQTIKLEDKELTKFSHYIPNNPNEYIFIIIDHISIIETESGLDLRQSINKLSEYLITLRNRYNYIPVVVQQQNIETTGLEAFKANKIRSTMAGLADSKATGKDCSVMLGISNPYSQEVQEYLGYDIRKLKGNFRILEVVLNRNGQSNGLCPLYFDGAVNFYKELPLPNDTINMNKVYNSLSELKKNTIDKVFFLFDRNKSKKDIDKKKKLFNFANFLKKLWQKS